MYLFEQFVFYDLGIVIAFAYTQMFEKDCEENSLHKMFTSTGK